MAADDHFESGGFGLQIELGQIVDDVNRDADQFNRVGFWQLLRPFFFVDVPTNSSNRSDRLQLLENFGRPHVSCMDDVLGVTQRLECFRSKQAMGIGDYADESGFLQLRVPEC